MRWTCWSKRSGAPGPCQA